MIWPFSPPRVRQVFNVTVCVTDFFTSLNFKPWSQTLSTVSIKCEGKRKKRQTCALINSNVIEGEIVTKFELENCEEVFWHVFPKAASGVRTANVKNFRLEWFFISFLKLPQHLFLLFHPSKVHQHLTNPPTVIHTEIPPQKKKQEASSSGNC